MVRLCVRNAGTSVVYFTYYTLLNWLQDFTLEDEQRVTRARPLTLAPGKTTLKTRFTRFQVANMQNKAERLRWEDTEIVWYI